MTRPLDEEQGAPSLAWPLHRYTRPLRHDRWFLVAAVMCAVAIVGRAWQHEWFLVLISPSVFWVLGGLRHVIAAFRAGYSEEGDGAGGRGTDR